MPRPLTEYTNYLSIVMQFRLHVTSGAILFASRCLPTFIKISRVQFLYCDTLFTNKSLSFVSFFFESRVAQFCNVLPRYKSREPILIKLRQLDGLPTSVSYTHLDVYKRQQLVCVYLVLLVLKRRVKNMGT